MGWERKRGKLEELNRLLRGATDTSFDVQVGRAGGPAGACATASRSTPTPACPATRARKLVGIIAHPLNRPRFDPACGRVTEGYGILQPRVSVTTASAAGSRFARIFAGHTGWTPTPPRSRTPTRTSSARGPSPARGSTTWTPSRRRWTGACPTTRSSRTTSSRACTPAPALVTDVEVVDDYPSSVLAHARRQHRWARGDWQILALALPLRPDPRRPARATGSRSSRAGRSSTTCGAACSRRRPSSCSCSAGRVLPGSPALWTGGRRGRHRLPALPAGARGRSPARRPQQPWRAFLRGLREDAGSGLARVAAAARLPRQPGLRDGARGRWSPWSGSCSPGAACSSGRPPRRARPAGAGREREPGARPFLVEMAASPAIAAGRPAAGRRPSARPRSSVAAPVLGALGRRAVHRPRL